RRLPSLIGPGKLSRPIHPRRSMHTIRHPHGPRVRIRLRIVVHQKCVVRPRPRLLHLHAPPATVAQRTHLIARVSDLHRHLGCSRSPHLELMHPHYPPAQAAQPETLAIAPSPKLLPRPSPHPLAGSSTCPQVATPPYRATRPSPSSSIVASQLPPRRLA